MFFQEKGIVFVTGDFNGRTGNKWDYVENDYDLNNNNDVSEVEDPLHRLKSDSAYHRFEMN